MAERMMTAAWGWGLAATVTIRDHYVPPDLKHMGWDFALRYLGTLANSAAPGCSC
jgi:hypothetical protein